MKIFKYIIYALTVLSVAVLAYEIYTNYSWLSVGFNEFMFSIKPAEEYMPEIQPLQIVLWVVCGVMLIFGSIVYLANMSNLGYRPLQLSYFIVSVVGCTATFGMYYFSIFWQGRGFWASDSMIVKVFQLIGCVVLIAELIVLIVKKTFRAIPLWLIYLSVGYLTLLLVIGIVQVILILIGVAIACAVGLSLGGGKKRLVDKDGNIYEEV